MGEATTLQDEPQLVGEFRVAHATDLGCVRSQNQDAAWAHTSSGQAFLVVADGMGGHTGGATASQAVIDVLAEVVNSGVTVSLEDIEPLVATAAIRVAEDAPDGGTTVVIALIDAERINVWHIGDSRAYVLRSTRLLQLTSDHSWVQSMVDQGRLSSEQAAQHPRRNVLLRALGRDRNPEPTHGSVRFFPEDTVLLCSDGLYGALEESAIAEIVAGSADVTEASQRLIYAARRNGAPDNIGVALASWQPDPDSNYAKKVQG